MLHVAEDGIYNLHDRDSPACLRDHQMSVEGRLSLHVHCLQLSFNGIDLCFKYTQPIPVNNSPQWECSCWLGRGYEETNADSELDVFLCPHPVKHAHPD